MTRAQVRLESVAGLHVLDGRAEWVERNGHFENSRHVAYRLDGLWYVFAEDPSDGYRSSLGSVHVLPDEELPAPGGSVSRWSPPTVVMIHHSRGRMADSHYNRDENVVRAFDESTGLQVLMVGTENTNDYYPSFVAIWNPPRVLNVP